jgi:hydrogenase-4 component B
MISAWLLLVAFAGLAVGIACAWHAPRVWLGATLIAATAALGAAVWVLAGGGTWDWQSAIWLGGQEVHLCLDGVSAFFMALLALLGGVGTVYSRGYWSDKEHPRSALSGRAWWNSLLLCMGLVLVSMNGLHFLIVWELFAVSAYFLITRERHKREVRNAGWLYLAASHAGTLCLFAFFTALAARTGTWELGLLRERQDLAPLFWLALAGFGLKAGLFPLHIWLPSAHANAPSHVSAILSGVAIKMGIFGLVRFSGWLPTPEAAGWVVVGLGVASAVLGVAFALGQHDLKRLLAYHSVENIGIILIGLGFAMVGFSNGNPGWAHLALAGGLLHVWNHGIFKALLFLGAGSVLHATGTREMSRLGGLWRSMPWTAACFALGAAAISGLPPLNGFISEFLVYLGLFGAVGERSVAAWGAIPATIFLAITGALALACFVKVVGVVFLGLPRTEAASHPHESGRLMVGPMVVLGAACVAIGVLPGLFWNGVAVASDEWLSLGSETARLGQRALPVPLVTLGICNAVFVLLGALAAGILWWRVKRNGLARTGTWDCGYAKPTARMQYTAGSFAGIITEWFNWILCPARHGHDPKGVFPETASRTSHTPETVLEKIVSPIGAAVMMLSTTVRRLQHGRLQMYILYLVIGLLALALLAFFGGKL